MNDNISPEERLLKLIRKGKKQDASIPVEKKTTAMPPGPESIIIDSDKGFLTKKYLSFVFIRRIIIIALPLSCIYLVISFVYPLFGLRKINLPEVRQERESELMIELKEDIKPYEFYSRGIRNREIFSSSSVQELYPKTQQPAGGINMDLVKDINLVGIVSGELPQAIIQDKKTQKTYYLGKGKFMGEFMVEDIQEGKVILNYKGQKFELYL